MRLPKRGFNVPNPKKLNAVNLGRLQQALDAGKLNASDAVNTASLKIAGVIRRELDGVRIIGNGELKTKLDFEVFGVSASAREAIEKLGGKITVLAPVPSKDDDDAKAEKKAKKKAAKKAEADVEETDTEEEALAEETASDDTDNEDNQSE
jgi:large subunit ribosomal protein L15